MAEVGLLPFARVTLEVSKTVIPRYRSRFSKHQFTQPQLLAILCLMRYEDWTFREAEVRLAEHAELRGCATLKLANRPAGLPIILESSTELTTTQGDDGVSTAHGPEHSRPFQPSQYSFTACLDDSRAHE